MKERFWRKKAKSKASLNLDQSLVDEEKEDLQFDQIQKIVHKGVQDKITIITTSMRPSICKKGQRSSSSSGLRPCFCFLFDVHPFADAVISPGPTEQQLKWRANLRYMELPFAMEVFMIVADYPLVCQRMPTTEFNPVSIQPIIVRR